MKTKYILLTAVLLFSFNSSTQAQHMGGDFMEGIQSTLNNSITEHLEDEVISRLWALFTNDIRMVMKADKRTEIFLLMKEGAGAYMNDLEIGEGSIYGEFDWDNEAASFHVKQAKGEKEDFLRLGGINISKGYGKKAIDAYQYMDQDGYWYIPSSPQANLGASHGYIKFHRRNAMMSLTGTMRNMAQTLEREGNEEIMRALTNAAGLDSESVGMLLTRYLPRLLGGSSSIENIEDALNSLLDRRFSQMMNMPFGFHWALIYSPLYVKQQGYVTETRVTHGGVPNCLLLTGAQGKYMIFDNYNRLVFINSGPKNGTVEYFYDSDVTVNLPEARLVNVGSGFSRD